MRRHKLSIPTLLAFLILILVIGGLTIGRDRATKLFSKAANNNFSIENISISNVSETGWTVSWTTEARTTGRVYYGKTELVDQGIALDGRDFPGRIGEYTTHLVTVRNVSPGGYFFKIGVGDERVGRGGIIPYQVVVPSPLKGFKKVDPIYGKVVEAGSLPVPNAIVIFNAAGSQTLSTLTNRDGGFVIPLTSLRSVDLKNVLEIKDGHAEQITVIGENFASSVVSCLSGYDRPVPVVTLGQSLNCSRNPNLPKVPH